MPSLDQRKIIFVVAIVVALVFVANILLAAPANFPAGGMVTIQEGASLGQVSALLKANNIIRSRLVFEALVILEGGEKRVYSGGYVFPEKESVLEVSRRIARGERRVPTIRVTIPEGYTAREIGEVFASKLNNFNQERFLQVATAKEGYLFPDTYFFFALDTEEEVLRSLAENYEKKIAPLREEIAALGKTEKEIIIMASLIEGEAKGDADRELISGILWRRLAIGMPLEVDIAPETYKKQGLPEGPVGNPGMKAILSAMRPRQSEYLFYLHGEDGEVHFAKNFEEHKKNKKLYLK